MTVATIQTWILELTPSHAVAAILALDAIILVVAARRWFNGLGDLVNCVGYMTRHVQSDQSDEAKQCRARGLKFVLLVAVLGFGEVIAAAAVFGP